MAMGISSKVRPVLLGITDPGRSITQICTQHRRMSLTQLAHTERRTERVPGEGTAKCPSKRRKSAKGLSMRSAYARRFGRAVDRGPLRRR